VVDHGGDLFGCGHPVGDADQSGLEVALARRAVAACALRGRGWRASWRDWLETRSSRSSTVRCIWSTGGSQRPTTGDTSTRSRNDPAITSTVDSRIRVSCTSVTFGDEHHFLHVRLTRVIGQEDQEVGLAGGALDRQVLDQAPSAHRPQPGAAPAEVVARPGSAFSCEPC
jgi:hypothetical protein